MATPPHPTPPGYRSETAFQFDEDQADAIIRTTAYHRFDYETSAIWFEFRAHASIRHNIAKPFQRPANAAMPGPLDRLPVELFHGILFRLDMHSLFKFRQVNLRSREMVDSLHEYQMVVKHGLNLYCALLRTKIGNEVTLREFYTVLCTKACFLCGEFASFVHLLTWKKSCLKCLQEAPELQVVTARMVQRSVRITKAEIKLLRTLKTFPGQYTMEHRKFKIRHVVVSEHHAWLNSTVSILFGFRRPRRDKRFEKYNFMASCVLPYYDRRTREVERGVSCAGCQLAIEKGIVRGHRGEKWPYEARDKLYARDGFLEHFRWCEQAQLLWMESDEGIHTPVDLPAGAQREGFYGKRK